jgi:hypothetical protein
LLLAEIPPLSREKEGALQRNETSEKIENITKWHQARPDPNPFPEWNPSSRGVEASFSKTTGNKTLEFGGV